MPGTPTSRLALPTIASATDDVSAYPAVNLSQMTTLDNAVTITEGTISNRPAGSYAGQTYYATDTGLWYFYTGSSWQTVMLAGAWTPFAFGAYVSTPSGQIPVAWRIVGDSVELDGVMVSSINMPSNQSWLTVPAAIQPQPAGSTRVVPAVGGVPMIGYGAVITGVDFYIEYNGLAAGTYIYLSGSYPLAR